MGVQKSRERKMKKKILGKKKRLIIVVYMKSMNERVLNICKAESNLIKIHIFLPQTHGVL